MAARHEMQRIAALFAMPEAAIQNFAGRDDKAALVFMLTDST
jgi:hypothetical protein